MRRPWLVAVVVASLLLALGAACSDGDDGFGQVFGGRTPSSPGVRVVPAAGGTSPAATVNGGHAPTPAATVQGTATPVATAAATPGSDGTSVVTCGDILAPLDKQHRLEPDCVPAALQALPADFSSGEQFLIPGAAAALFEMFAAAAVEGHNLVVVSSFRSYQTQQNTFQSHVDMFGLAHAERVSARPGHSEHQLGATVDIASASVGFELLEAFGDTAEGQWLADHGFEFGFVISYPAGLEAVTGYGYEPWHLRWVGMETAAAVRSSGLTLGEFLLN